MASQVDQRLEIGVQFIIPGFLVPDHTAPVIWIACAYHADFISIVDAWHSWIRKEQRYRQLCTRDIFPYVGQYARGVVAVQQVELLHDNLPGDGRQEGLPLSCH